MKNILVAYSTNAGSTVEAAEAGIRHLWIQQGCQFHRFHRWIWKLLGKLPK